jgi:hypothetical protein
VFLPSTIRSKVSLLPEHEPTWASWSFRGDASHADQGGSLSLKQVYYHYLIAGFTLLGNRFPNL